MSNPRSIELQLSGATLATMVLNRARTEVFFAPGTITISSPNDAIVDHITFSNNPGIVQGSANTQTIQLDGGGSAQIQVPSVRFMLGLNIFLKFLAVAQDPSKPETDYAALPNGIPTTLTLDLSVTGTTNPELCLTVADLTSTLNLPGLAAQLQTVKTSLQGGGPLCVPFDVSALASLVGTVQAQNVVMAMQTDNVGNVTAVAIRVEIGSAAADTQTNWQNFVSAFQNTLSTEGPDWNVLIDPQTIVDLAVGEIQGGLQNLSGYTMDSPVTGSWILPGQFGGGQIAFSNDGHFAVSECPNNIGVTISGTVDLQFSGGDLVEHGFVDWDLNDGDVFVCGLTYGGPAGAVIGTAIAPGIGTAIGAVVGTAIGVTIVAIFATVISGNKTLVGNFSAPGCKVVDQHDFVCSTSLALPAIDFGNGINAKLTVTAMVGQSTGLLLGGTAFVTPIGDPVFNISQPDASVPVGITGQCFSFQPGYAFSVALTGSDGPPVGPTTAIYGTYSAPDIEILNDPLNVYSYSLNPDLSQWLPITMNFLINLPQSSPYFNKPYRPTLYVRTTSGAYSVLLPELQPYTSAQLAGIQQGILTADIGCNKEASGWLGQPGAYNPHWSVDPGPEGDINIWEVIVAGLVASEQVSAQTTQGLQIATATTDGLFAQISIAASGLGARAGAVAPLSFARTIVAGATVSGVGVGAGMVAAAPLSFARTTVAGAAVSGVGAGVVAAAPLSFARTAVAEATGAPATEAGAALRARIDQRKLANSAVQRSLRKRATWSALGGTLTGVTMGIYKNNVAAIVAGSGGVEIVGLRTPARPTLLAILPDAAGAMPLGSGLLTWNERGLFQDGRRVSGAAEPVMAVAARRGVIYVLGRDGVTIFDSRLAHIGTIAGSTGTGMAAVGNRLVLADAQGLRTYDLTSPERPGTACSFPLPGIQSFETTSVGGSQRVLAALAEGHFTIVDVAGDVALIAARYNQRPWFAGSACLRDVTVRPAGSANIDIFTPGPKATMRF